MKPSFQRIAGLNLAVVLATAITLRLLNQGRESEIGFVLLMAMAIAAHSLILTILALTSHPPENRSNYWLSLLLVWLLGFGACAAGSSITL